MLQGSSEFYHYSCKTEITEIHTVIQSHQEIFLENNQFVFCWNTSESQKDKIQVATFFFSCPHTCMQLFEKGEKAYTAI